MSEKVTHSVWERSTLVRCLRWLFSWRGIRAILIVLAWVATAIALLYGIENWRGRRAWNKYARELQARGEQLDLKALIPKPIPDPENFAATPLVQAWFPKATWQWDDNFEKLLGKISTRKNPAHKGNRQFTDLVSWQMGLGAIDSDDLEKKVEFDWAKFDRKLRERAAPAVLEGLKDFEQRRLELLTASARPNARYPVHYDLDNPWGIPLPHLTRLKGACQRLQLSASAKLAARNTAGALEDVKLILYLSDSLEEEPLLISYLVRVACLQIAIQPIWEGLAEHRWSEAQLEAIQSRLASYNFFPALTHAMDVERAAAVLTADLLRQGKYRLSHLAHALDSQHSTTLADWLARIAPHGWYHREKLNYCILLEKHTEGTFDVEKKRVFPRIVKEQDKELQRELAGSAGANRVIAGILRHRVLAALLLPALGHVARRPATAQTSADQAAIACALERYRLANGQFPEKLDSLIPKYMSQLPADVITGEPYKYRRTVDGQFVLYSVGWNETDDGGTPGSELHDTKQGDWVWQYPSEQSMPNAALN